MSPLAVAGVHQQAQQLAAALAQGPVGLSRALARVRAAPAPALPVSRCRTRQPGLRIPASARWAWRKAASCGFEVAPGRAGCHPARNRRRPRPRASTRAMHPGRRAHLAGGFGRVAPRAPSTAARCSWQVPGKAGMRLVRLHSAKTSANCAARCQSQRWRAAYRIEHSAQPATHERTPPRRITAAASSCCVEATADVALEHQRVAAVDQAEAFDVGIAQRAARAGRPRRRGSARPPSQPLARRHAAGHPREVPAFGTVAAAVEEPSRRAAAGRAPSRSACGRCGSAPAAACRARRPSCRRRHRARHTRACRAPKATLRPRPAQIAARPQVSTSSGASGR